MPKWRKLWTKTTEDFGLHDMPDDTTRLAWVLLPLALDREGRGIDNAAWLKAKLFPLRLDLDHTAMAGMLEWWAARGLIERYEIEGRTYFWVPSFAAQQGDTRREAESHYPAPPCPVEANSGVGQDRVEGGSGSDTDTDTDTDRDTDADADSDTDTEAGVLPVPLNRPAVLLSGSGLTRTPAYALGSGGPAPPGGVRQVKDGDRRRAPCFGGRCAAGIGAEGSRGPPRPVRVQAGRLWEPGQGERGPDRGAPPTRFEPGACSGRFAGPALRGSGGLRPAAELVRAVVARYEHRFASRGVIVDGEGELDVERQVVVPDAGRAPHVTDAQGGMERGCWAPSGKRRKACRALACTSLGSRA